MGELMVLLRSNRGIRGANDSAEARDDGPLKVDVGDVEPTDDGDARGEADDDAVGDN
jgi:hypothetical protein